ncbi:hypothetical protein NQ314_008067 [Rhamnusium bicolor]|uniref:THAP-type domain-containing protein n=1 Tax=Rhamnusium bicolor TaxID=1586634 RepID=A0AAV8YHS5_9CUCU|nr:hypothetical protein NQ314_008067 [Rhamnusium bicolor]
MEVDRATQDLSQLTAAKAEVTKKEPEISFHRFPKDKEKCNTWVKNMKIADWTPLTTDRICSKHFEERFLYKTDMKVKLLNEAIGTKRLRTPEPQPSTSMTADTTPRVDDTPRKKKLRRRLFQALRKKS